MSKEKVYVNDSGEHIRRMPDGTEHISRDPEHSQVLSAHLAATDDRKAQHAKLVDIKHERVAAKKERQAAKGWPPDKSPV